MQRMQFWKVLNKHKASVCSCNEFEILQDICRENLDFIDGMGLTLSLPPLPILFGMFSDVNKRGKEE